MKLEVFQMERYQSNWENQVDCNLSESGVHPWRLRDFLSETELEEFLDLRLCYPQSNGTLELRRTIAGLYEGATPENVLLTTGTSEANYVSTLALLEPGDEVVLMLPNYMQIWGLARSQGAEIRPFRLLEARAWSPDLEELRAAVSGKTRLIAICNPNNPTGAVLSQSEMDVIVDVAARNGAWLLADEVYRGAELEGPETPTFWGRYPKLIITSGLSKAYSLPGLRVGWIAGPTDWVEHAWSYRDYTTIAVGTASDWLARLALGGKRDQILARTREILRSNLEIVRAWVASHSGLFSLVEPRAGAILYLRYHFPIDSMDLAEQLRKKHSVLVVPGEHFQMGRYIRIGYGYTADALREGLSRIDRCLDELGVAVGP